MFYCSIDAKMKVPYDKSNHTQTRPGPYSEFLVKVFNFFWGFFFITQNFSSSLYLKKDRQIFLNKKHVEDAIWFVYYFVCISNTKMIDLHSNSKSGNFKETKLWVRLNFMNRYSKLEFSLLILVKINYLFTEFFRTFLSFAFTVFSVNGKWKNTFLSLSFLL